MHSARPTQAVTTARRSQREDRRSRMRTYLIAMGFRTAAFPLAVWALVNGWTVAGWLLAVAAVGLPPIAVTLANTVDHRRGTDQPVSPVRALPAGIPPDDVQAAPGRRAGASGVPFDGALDDDFDDPFDDPFADPGRDAAPDRTPWS